MAECCTASDPSILWPGGAEEDIELYVKKGQRCSEGRALPGFSWRNVPLGSGRPDPLGRIEVSSAACPVPHWFCSSDCDDAIAASMTAGHKSVWDANDRYAQRPGYAMISTDALPRLCGCKQNDIELEDVDVPEGKIVANPSRY